MSMELYLVHYSLLFLLHSTPYQEASLIIFLSSSFGLSFIYYKYDKWLLLIYKRYFTSKQINKE